MGERFPATAFTLFSKSSLLTFSNPTSKSFRALSVLMQTNAVAVTLKIACSDRRRYRLHRFSIVVVDAKSFVIDYRRRCQRAVWPPAWVLFSNPPQRDVQWWCVVCVELGTLAVRISRSSDSHAERIGTTSASFAYRSWISNRILERVAISQSVCNAGCIRSCCSVELSASVVFSSSVCVAKLALRIFIRKPHSNAWKHR